jgi:hypothetical protein
MTAYLDRTRSWGERNGGVSDPRLIRRLEHIPPNTEEEIATVKRMIATHFPGADPASTTTRAQLEAMLLPADDLALAA